MAKQPPTRRQLEVLRAYIRAGSVAAAAFDLGVTESTTRQHLSGLYRRIGCTNAAQAAYLLGIGQLGNDGPLLAAQGGQVGDPDVRSSWARGIVE